MSQHLSAVPAMAAAAFAASSANRRLAASIPNRISGIWGQVRPVVDYLIRTAEEDPNLPSGEARAKWVSTTALQVLRDVEARANLLPALVETMVFAAIEAALPAIVGQVFRQLDGEGVVNVHRTRA